MKAFKVLERRVEGDGTIYLPAYYSEFISRPEYAMRYIPDEWVSSPVDHSRLFTFDNTLSARRWSSSTGRGNCIWEVEVDGVEDNPRHFFSGADRHSISNFLDTGNLKDTPITPPIGSMAVKRVKLIKELKQMI